MNRHQHLNEHKYVILDTDKHVIPDTVPGSPFHSLTSSLSALLFCLCTLVLLTSCSDFIHPVKSTPEPTEYSFNYWLLQNIYLYEEELPNLPEEGDSVQVLYQTLQDRFTTYTPPAKSETKATQTNTSLVIGGDVGMRYYNITDVDYPIFVSRVYPKSPAGRAGIPRYGNILKVNGIELKGGNAKAIYDSVLTFNKNINLLIAYNSDTTLFKLQKEDVYAPTIFVDTLFEDSAKGFPGIVFVTIEGFKPTTADQKKGTYGELKAYLDSTATDKRVRVLDLRGNPGGHVNQCLDMADLFVREGTLSTRRSRTLTADGASTSITETRKAKPGDPGESGKYLIIANQGSASCAEIFIAAVTETTDIPFVGRTTYGKGIGQTNFWTYAHGIATITDIEFLTPKGNSYHGKGIVPKYTCENIIGYNCAAQMANKIYGVKIPKQDAALAKRVPELTESSITEQDGGAIEWANSDIYLKAFQHLEH